MQIFSGATGTFVLGRLRDLQYIFAVTYETLCARIQSLLIFLEMCVSPYCAILLWCPVHAVYVWSTRARWQLRTDETFLPSLRPLYARFRRLQDTPELKKPKIFTCHLTFLTFLTSNDKICSLFPFFAHIISAVLTIARYEFNLTAPSFLIYVLLNNQIKIFVLIS